MLGCGVLNEGACGDRCLGGWRLWIGRSDAGDVLFLLCVEVLNVVGLCVTVGGRSCVWVGRVCCRGCLGGCDCVINSGGSQRESVRWACGCEWVWCDSGNV